MMRSLFTGASGMRGQQSRIDVVSNNLANVNTAGFKGDRAEFTDLMYQQLRTPGGTSATGVQWPTPLEVGLGVNFVATAKDFKQGNVIATEQPLDLLIEGDGFFQVQLPDGRTAYTRDGTFKKDVNGAIVTNRGNFMLPNINIPEDAISLGVSAEGNVTVKQPGSDTDNPIGDIELVRFSNPQGLQAIGSNLFIANDASGPAIPGTPGQEGIGTIQQGAYEGSNVSVVDELVQLIVSQRAFEANSKSVQTSDDMLQVAVNLKR